MERARIHEVLSADSPDSLTWLGRPARANAITDQHSTAGRAPSRVGITRTVPPGRPVAMRGYPPPHRYAVVARVQRRPPIRNSSADVPPSTNPQRISNRPLPRLLKAPAAI